jgi:hypothetical protein
MSDVEQLEKRIRVSLYAEDGKCVSFYDDCSEVQRGDRVSFIATRLAPFGIEKRKVSSNFKYIIEELETTPAQMNWNRRLGR